MTYVFGFDEGRRRSLADLTELIGGKAASLSLMASLGLPVPPGFSISTAACRQYLAGEWPSELDDEIGEHVAEVEAAIGRRYGDPDDPLLVSVRSGAPASMPGMMDTILNVGLNELTERGLARRSGDAGFAADCRRRLESMYRNSVGADPPSDPWEQLRGAIEAVFLSWNAPRARAYRRHDGIPDEMGTGATVQAMVFGNRAANSATGVLFTRNPATGEPDLYGDVMFKAQGEDVVAGHHSTEPISVLDERMPELAAELRQHAATLERHLADMCDIEFTIEDGRLWLLQVRVGKRSPAAALRMAIDMAEDSDFPLSREQAVARVAPILAEPPRIGSRPEGAIVLATGLAASPGIAAGQIALSSEEAVAAARAGRRVVLVRPTTSPDDVQGMACAAGVLTATGGLASHAAVVARGWGIPAVVGAVEVLIDEDHVRIGSRTLRRGEWITLDGNSGDVLLGEVAAGGAPPPAAAILGRWANEVAGAMTATSGGDAPQSGASAARTAPDAEEVLRALRIKGYATTEAIALALGSSVETTAAVVERLTAGGLVEEAAGAIRPTAEGRTLGDALLVADGERWGRDRAAAALDAFAELDARMKRVVHAWQVRVVDGADALNDHADAAHDRSVLDELAALHAETEVWLRPHLARVPRLARYGERLGAAAARAEAGDAAYVASPRVDSYHGVWFELHEELIRLAGRTREEEVAAGRA